MFKITDMSPEIEFGDNAHKKLADIYSKKGSKAGIITSALERSSGNLKKICNVLKLAGINYVIFDQVKQDFNSETITNCYNEFQKLKPDGIIALGGLNERMCARETALLLELSCIEIPTTFSNPFLLVRKSLLTDKTRNFTTLNSPEKVCVNAIIIDYKLLPVQSNADIVLQLSELLLYTSEVTSSYNATFFTRELSQRATEMALESLQNADARDSQWLINTYRAGLFSAASSSSAPKESHKITTLCWALTRRFNIPPFSPFAILLPWYLEKEKKEELANTIRPLIAHYNLPGRLKELGLELSQIESIIPAGDISTKELITGAY